MSEIFTDKYVDSDFAQRAIEHFKKTEKPLLEYRLDEYTENLYARHDSWGDGYTLYGSHIFDDSGPYIEPLSWREFAEKQGDELSNVFENYSVSHPFPDPDEEVPYEILLDYYGCEEDDYIHFAQQEAFQILEVIEIGEVVDWREHNNNPLGYVEFVDGYSPGNDFMGFVVSSSIALACLQHRLDNLGTGIKIELYEQEDDSNIE